MILLSISPFIFIQCGSGGQGDGTREQTGKAHPRDAGGGYKKQKKPTDRVVLL